MVLMLMMGLMVLMALLLQREAALNTRSRCLCRKNRRWRPSRLNGAGLANFAANGHNDSRDDRVFEIFDHNARG